MKSLKTLLLRRLRSSGTNLALAMLVIPAQARILGSSEKLWIPACAGMTDAAIELRLHITEK